MPTSQDRILTTHVGSLVRPPELSRYIEAIDNGVKVDQAAFDRCLADSVADVIKRQRQVGVDVVSDGEFGKFRSWSFYVLDRLGGIEERAVEAARGAGRDQQMFADFYAEYFPTQKLPKRGTVVCVGPLTYKGRAAVRKDIEIFKAGLKGAAVADAFLPVVAPASAVPRHKNEYYKDDEEFLFKLAEALREEYKAIVDAGLMVQIDDAFLPYMYDVAFAADQLEQYRKWAAVRVEALNHAIEGLPEDRIRYHICWGSFNTPHVTDVPLKDIVDLVLRVKAGGYCIEMGNPRHEHEWRVWENVKLPPGRKLIPGVISHSTNVVEHPELVAEWLTRLARLVGLRTCWAAPIAASRNRPMCGACIRRSCGRSSRRLPKARGLRRANCGDGRPPKRYIARRGVSVEIAQAVSAAEAMSMMPMPRASGGAM
jgi:5-methyltetrahydropteroyltriglutamate--homocysteine methyltransferase